MKKNNFIFIACALILAVFAVFSMAAKPVKQVKPAHAMTLIQNPKQDCTDENCEKEDCGENGEECENSQKEAQKPKKEKRGFFGKKNLKVKDDKKHNEKQQENRKEAR